MLQSSQLLPVITQTSAMYKANFASVSWVEQSICTNSYTFLAEPLFVSYFCHWIITVSRWSPDEFWPQWRIATIFALVIYCIYCVTVISANNMILIFSRGCTDMTTRESGCENSASGTFCFTTCTGALCNSKDGDQLHGTTLSLNSQETIAHHIIHGDSVHITNQQLTTDQPTFTTGAANFVSDVLLHSALTILASTTMQ